jgi:DNA-binding CsgD family transcriptional regulator
LLELEFGRTEEAFLRAREISTTPAVLSMPGHDRIEAAVRAGEVVTARNWLDNYEAWAECAGSPWARAVALHGRALLAEDDEESERLFEAALDMHAKAARPFERARIELAFGEFLRRARRPRDARRHLRAALDGFEALGAELWAEQAASSCARGQTARRRVADTRDQLTEQELQIAHFVAQGLTNREVAAQLFLSPRTIAAQLRNSFRKLGISSRTELARLHLEFVCAATRRTRPLRHASVRRRAPIAPGCERDSRPNGRCYGASTHLTLGAFERSLKPQASLSSWATSAAIRS